MRGYILKRGVSLFLTFLVVMSAIFFLARTGMDPFAMMIESDPRIPREAVERLRQKFGLDKPMWQQYLSFMVSMFQGEFGHSVTFRRPVFDVLRVRLPWTILLLGISISISTLGAVLLGAYTAWNRGKKIDLVGTNLSLFVRAMPHFWLGMLFLLVLGYYMDWFPLFGIKSSGIEYANIFEKIKDIAWHLTLPLLTLVVRQIGMYTLYMRGETLEVLNEDFISTAKAKGLSDSSVLFKHAVRTSMLPMVTVTALRFGFMVNGAILTETVFSLPGTGRLIYQAINSGDYFLLQGAFFITSITVLVANFIADILYSYLDPRVKR